MASAATETAGLPRENERELLALAQTAIGTTGVGLAKLLGVSKRTVVRWYGGYSSIGTIPLGKLAPHVYAKDAALGRRLHAYASARLAVIGLPPPPPLPVHASGAAAYSSRDEGSPESLRVLVDGVVCAASEAMDVSARAVRSGLCVALRRARELGLSVEELERELAPRAKPDATRK